MRVWFAASEAVPLVKTGGLADVIGALPRALASRGVDVTVVLPKYGEIPAAVLAEAVTIDTCQVTLGWRKQYCGLQQVVVDGVRFLLIDNEYYFKRGQLYGYGDEAERFVFFSMAVMEALIRAEETPDVLHCHDWQTGLVPMLLRTRYAYHPAAQQVKTVYTIHNLQYQGVFGRELLQDLLGAGDELFTEDRLEFYGAGNCMKAGLQYADKLTTVSPTYAEEIQTPAYGEKLDGVVRWRAGDLQGILNGIDLERVDPMHDRHIAVPYRDSLAKKAKNKVALQEELGLRVDPEAPMIGIVSRLVSQKGLDLLVGGLDRILGEDDEVQLVILGSGDPELEHQLGQGMARYPERMLVWFGFNAGLANRIYAGADVFLMPSRFEPCGLGQLIALRYRTVPIVRETGGLRDTIEPYNEFTGQGNGFSFAPAAVDDLVYTVHRALDFYRDKETWGRIVANGAKRSFGWDASAQQYEALYQGLVE